MPAKVFQVQSKDSVVKLNAFDAINAVQNLSLDPRFNEEYYSEMGNANFTDVSRQPETGGSFDVTATGSIAAMLARMNYNYTTQSYQFDPSTKGNTYTLTEVDMENLIFDLINLKQPGLTFSQASLVPNAQLNSVSFRVDSNGTGSESYSFDAALQEEFYKPYHDMVSIPMTTLSSGTIQVPAAYQSLVASGTHNIMYVFKDNEKFRGSIASPQATWSSQFVITVPTANFKTAAPFDRVVAVLFKIVPGAFPTIYYPTTSRFVRGDRADVWLVSSGTSGLSDANRLLRCQSADVNVPLGRDRLTEIRRNNDESTVYYRAINYPLSITANIQLNETTLQQWADLQGKVLNESASSSIVDANNVMNLSDFIDLKLVIKYYKKGNDVTPLCTVTLDDINVNSFSNRQQVGGRGERTLGLTGSRISIVGNTL